MWLYYSNVTYCKLQYCYGQKRVATSHGSDSDFGAERWARQVQGTVIPFSSINHALLSHHLIFIAFPCYCNSLTASAQDHCEQIEDRSPSPPPVIHRSFKHSFLFGSQTTMIVPSRRNGVTLVYSENPCARSLSGFTLADAALRRNTTCI